MDRRGKIIRITTLGIFSALSVLAAGLIQFPILPGAIFLKYDPADIFLLICGFLYGPLWGIAPVFITASLQEVFFGSSGWIGALMHFLASGTLVAVSASIYRVKRSRLGAIVALCVGSLSMVAVMIPLNLIFTPMYTGRPVEEVAKLILPAILPFNAIKAFGNSLLTMLLYKYISRFIKTGKLTARPVKS